MSIMKNSFVNAVDPDFTNSHSH